MTILIGDCVELLRTLPDESVDAICTDPPYGIAFMGKQWDTPKMLGHNPTNGEGDVRGGLHYGPGTNSRGYADHDGHAFQAWCEDWARELLRVAKPGAHLLAFGGARTYHRMVCAIEDAGWEIRDCIQWVYATGFPKSLNVSKAIDKKAGAVREVVGRRTDRASRPVEDMRGGRLIGGEAGAYDNSAITAPATEAARQWDGWGTGLKPASEPIVVARKPLVGTVIENVQRYGTGALNIEACRIGVETRTHGAGSLGANGIYGRMDRNETTTTVTGRWPANLIFDEEAAALLDAQSGQSRTRRNEVPSEAPDGNTWGGTFQTNRGARGHSDEGGASRFFFVAKPTPGERWGILTCDCETDKLSSWETKPDQSRDELTDSMSPTKGTFEGTSTESSDLSMSPNGSDTTGQFHPAITYITKTSTSRTGISTTSNSSTSQATSASIAGAKCGTEYGGNPAVTAANTSRLTRITGTSPPKGGPCTGDVGVATSLRSSLPSVCAKCGSEMRLEAHPTQKPVTLMRHLVRLVTPPGGVVLDPFCGSGTTGMAALAEGMQFIGIEREEDYAAIANARIAWQGGTVVEERHMFTEEGFVGDNLVPAEDVAPITKQVDMWKVTARPFREPEGTVIYWQSTVGGNKYGPYQRIDDLFGTIERQIGVENDRAAKKYRYGGAQDGTGRAKGADQRTRKGHVL